MTLWSNSTFPTLERDWEESSQGKAAKSSTNINPNVVDYKGSCHLWGYHNYMWGRAQSQVTYSLDTMPKLLITTLAMRNN
jgi:hypothetical protein